MLKHITLGIYSLTVCQSYEILPPLWSRVLEKASEKYSKIVTNSTGLQLEQRRGPKSNQRDDVKISQSNVKNQINPILIQTLNGYGCWCYFDGTMGKATTQDSYDAICKVLSQNYQCAEIENNNCIPWSQSYNELQVEVVGENVFTE